LSIPSPASLYPGIAFCPLGFLRREFSSPGAFRKSFSAVGVTVKERPFKGREQASILSARAFSPCVVRQPRINQPRIGSKNFTENAENGFKIDHT